MLSRLLRADLHGIRVETFCRNVSSESSGVSRIYSAWENSFFLRGELLKEAERSQEQHI